jgi:hypothetical protein
MAIDRERRESITIITRITYDKPGPDLLQRTKIKVKDVDDVVHVISDSGWVNVGKRSAFKKGLKEDRDFLVGEIEKFTNERNDEIDFLNEQITDIEAL